MVGMLVSCGGKKNAKNGEVKSETVEVEAATQYEGPLYGISDMNIQYWFIDTLGRVVLGPYDHADDFCEGLSRVWKRMRGADNPGDWEWDRDWSEGKWGFIDRTGDFVIEPKYDAARGFSEGLAAVRTGDETSGKWGYIDKSGKWVIEPKYAEAQSFSEGVAFVKERIGEGYVEYCIDKKGNMLFERPERTSDEFHDGLAIIIIDGKWGYMDKSCAIAIEPSFSYAEDFSEGMARVGIGEGDSIRYGFIDKSGKMVIEPKYNSAGSFNEGLAVVSIDGKYGYIDKRGKVVVNLVYDGADAFSEGLAGVWVGGQWWEGGKQGYIDKTGKMVIEAQYCWAGLFENGMAKVGLGDDYKDGKCGYITRKGVLVWQGFELID
ncbi:MAG: WG repeat-containing protein [Bacteroidales bacterium]|nr:WG repeat-containing protein [Bacteroidales bacterium]